MTTASLPITDRVEQGISTVAFTLFIAAVALAWPVAELTRFLLEKLFCRER